MIAAKSKLNINARAQKKTYIPTHDIIDNRKEKLVDHINRILSSTESARFALGYFFLSGLTSIAEKLAGPI